MPSHNIRCYDVAVSNKMEDGEMAKSTNQLIQEDCVAATVAEYLKGHKLGIAGVSRAANAIVLVLDDGSAYQITVEQTTAPK